MRLQGVTEKLSGIYYEFDPQSTPLGEGAMGRVFKGYLVVEATGQQQPVAVKCIYDGIPERIIERARREAAVRIDHENLLRMYAFIEVPHNNPQNGGVVSTKSYYVVMELLEGITLHDFLKSNLTDATGHTYPELELLHEEMTKDKPTVIRNIMCGILDGLQALHDAGFLHRDLDPSNIMITAEGGLKIIDFGICKQLYALNTQDKGLTVSGVFMGKPDYASPELAIGDVVHQNQTTDIYAVGVILFELCTGHVPFTGANNDVLAAHMRKPLPVKEMDMKHLRRVVTKATEKVQGKRYQSAKEFKADLILTTMPDGDGNKHKKMIVAALATALVVSAVLVIWILAGNGSTKQEQLQEIAKVDTTGQSLRTTAQYHEELLLSEDTLPTDSTIDELVKAAEKLIESGQRSTIRARRKDKVEEGTKSEETNVQVQSEVDEQPKQKVEVIDVYYVIGTKDELQEKGLLTKGNLFKKKKVVLENADKSKFIKADQNTLYRIRIPASAKKVKLLTGNLEDSYTVEEIDDDHSVLIIRKPKTFWFYSKYLIIRI